MNARILLFLLLAACGAADERLVGAWKMDVETLEFSPRFRAMSPAGKRGVIGKTRFNLTFTGDTLTWDHAMWGWGSDRWEARYEVREMEGNRIRIELLFGAEFLQEAEEPPAEELRKSMRRNRHMTFTVTRGRLQFSLGGRSIVCRRK